MTAQTLVKKPAPIVSKTISKTAKKLKAKKTAIVTYRFSVTPKMAETLEKLEQKYVMLDRTEIVKLSISSKNQT